MRLRGSSWALALPLSGVAGTAGAASTEGCEGGGFTVLGFKAPQDRVVAASALGAGDVITVRGLVLTSAVELELKEESLEMLREGPGLTMKVQAKDCAQGGVFQMEPERADQRATLFTHILSAEAFYFDNGNFRQREGETVPYKDTTILVPSRFNFGNGFSRKFVGRDSAQVAERLDEPGCANGIRKRSGAIDTVQHCGRLSRWMVASGGRMGQVMGEDAVEVAPPATVCVRKCQARNRVRGQAVVLGSPFPVPLDQRLKPPFPPGFRLP